MNEPLQEHDGRVQEIDYLVTLQLNGDATETELEELGRLLRDNPQAASHYVEMIQDASSLRCLSEATEITQQRDSAEWDTPQFTSPFSLKRTSGERSQKDGLSPATLFVAVSLLLVAGLIISKAWQGDPAAVAIDSQPVEPSSAEIAATNEPTVAVSPPRGPQEVATILRLKNVAWSKDNADIEELARLEVGQTLHFSSGELELVFDRAVRMLVRGPALLEIRGDDQVYSRFGILSARVGEAGKGFIIDTPNGRIVDLGTEFGVDVNERGTTDVAVFRGAVDLSYGSEGDTHSPSITRRLVQGQALTMLADGSMKRLTAYDESRFPLFSEESFMQPLPEPSLFTSVSDNLRDGIDLKSYRIVPRGLREDAPAYVDRQHQWNGIDDRGIPSALLGADYIMPFNHDKYSRKLAVELSIGRPARLYLFMSEVSTEPKWLTSQFEKTDMRIGLDESGEFMPGHGYKLAKGAGEEIDSEFIVWQRDVAVPEKISLGNITPAQRGWGFCMYGIAAVPLEVARHYDAAASN